MGFLLGIMGICWFFLNLMGSLNDTTIIQQIYHSIQFLISAVLFSAGCICSSNKRG
jgi:hypothetical protein